MAGVALDPGPIAGIIDDPVSLMAALPVLARWNAYNRSYTLPKKLFDTKFANTAPAALRDRAYEKYVIPTSGRLFAQAATGIDVRIDPKRRTQPLADKGNTGAKPSVALNDWISMAATSRSRTVDWNCRKCGRQRDNAICEPQWRPSRSEIVSSEVGARSHARIRSRESRQLPTCCRGRHSVRRLLSLE